MSADRQTTRKAASECHICHRPLDEPGELYCSAAHPLPSDAASGSDDVERDAAEKREGYWTGTFVHASDPEWIAELLNRRYDALFRLWNEAPDHLKPIAEEGLRR